MSLKVNVTRDLDVTIMEMAGRVTLGEGSVTYRDAVREALWNGHRKFAVDYGKISYQDSSGNGEVVSAFTTVRNSGGDLVLFDLTKRIQDMFNYTKLAKCFRIFDSRSSALAYFDSTRKTETKVSERLHLGVSILSLEGALSEGFSSSEVVSATLSALNSGAESVILQCRQVLEIDHEGAKSVIMASRSVRERGGELVLTGVEERLHQAFSKEGILNEVPVYVSTWDALKALKESESNRKGRYLQVVRGG